MGSGPNPKFFEWNAAIDGSVQRENAGFFAPGQAPIKMNLDKILMTVSLTIPLLTTPANKSFTITDLYLSHDAATPLRIALLVGTTPGNAVPIFSGPVKGDTAPIQGVGQETQFDVPAGCTLYLTWAASAGTNLYANIAGCQQAIGAG
jgi:hypothetical protein